jgi:hypothetical protein
MNAELRVNSARRHLATFEESWKQDHAEAMRCRDFEAFLEEGVWVFDLVDHVFQTLREQVYRGHVEAKPVFGDWEKGCYGRWLKTADLLATELERFEKSFVVEGAAVFRKRRDLARKRLHDWTPPELARSVSARVWDVSEDAADAMRELLRAPAGAPGRFKWQPKMLPTGDPSLLR